MKHFRKFISLNFILILACKTLICQYPSEEGIKPSSQESNTASEGIRVDSWFKEVPDNVNLIDYHYVETHNAHTYPPFFSTAQQLNDINTQLQRGVRGFKLKTYNAKDLKPTDKKVGEGNIVLCHGSLESGVDINLEQDVKDILSAKGLGVVSWCETQKIGTEMKYQTLKYEMDKIIKFLKDNPKEIVIVFIENPAGGKLLEDELEWILKENNALNLVFKPSDWNPIKKSGTPHQWPTLGWLRERNKQLMINSFHVGGGYGKHGKLVWDDYAINNWNEYEEVARRNPTYACKSLSNATSVKAYNRRYGPEGKHKTLSYMNHFTHIPLTLDTNDVKKDHEYNMVLNMIKSCLGRGTWRGKIPNGYLGDQIVASVERLKQEGKKTVFDLVNELNQSAATNTLDKFYQNIDYSVII